MLYLPVQNEIYNWEFFIIYPNRFMDMAFLFKYFFVLPRPL